LEALISAAIKRNFFRCSEKNSKNRMIIKPSLFIAHQPILLTPGSHEKKRLVERLMSQGVLPFFKQRYLEQILRQMRN
jgi:hypothetical protein